MTSTRAPDWLADFQARFGAILRTPLDRSTGTLRATPADYDPGVDAPRSRLAVYNRQYWFRLFTVMHNAFPLVTRLVGHWAMNDHAARFLLAHPPRSWDIDRVPDGFEAFFAVTLDAPDRDALVEAAHLDAAWRSVFAAPPAAPYRPTPEDAAGLLDARLIPSPAVALVEEHWPLSELRRAVLADGGDARVALPPALPHARWSMLVRKADGMLRLDLEAREAELYRLLRLHAVKDALGLLEAACSGAERADLPRRAQAWLARSVELGLWIGIQPQMMQL